MSRYGGYAGKVLLIDLDNKEVKDYPWSDEDRELFLGGKIMAAKILYDNIRATIDPLSPENLLVITTGPLTGTGTPSTSRFNISAISPLTGLAASSNCGGSFGIHLKKAGYDGIVFTGRAGEKTWVEITEKGVRFHRAEDIWGKTTGETQRLLGGRSGKLVIGPAGENLVKYASIVSEERVAGRAGIGAVMGSKNLKAVTASGTVTVEVKQKKRLKEINKKWVEALKSHPMTGIRLPRFGTAGLLKSMNAKHMLATRNYKKGQFGNYEKLSGEYIADKYLIKNKGCVTCPIQCGRVVEVGGRAVKGPELETIGLLGSNLENDDMERINEWNYLLDELGMDTMSVGSTIAFAMELNEKGLWSNGLEFGKTKNITELLKDIAYRKGIGSILADGSRRVSEIFGGKEYAIHVKGLELAAYEPRGAVGQGLGYAVSNRGGCHLNGGYLVFMEGLGLNADPYTHKSKAELTIMFQDLMEAVSAAGSCLFTTYAMLPGILISKSEGRMNRILSRLIIHTGGIIDIINKHPGLLFFKIPMIPHVNALEAVTGMKMSLGRFKKTGERGYNLERLLNIRLGLTYRDDNLPERLEKELQIPEDERTRVSLGKMLKAYYKSREWDSQGIPLKSKLKKLGL